jgi:two-component system NtrC family sensor kinase
VNAIIQSVERCSGITHRLLGLAGHMDLRVQRVNLEALLREVLSFLEGEVAHRSIEVRIEDLVRTLPRATERGE